MQRPISTLAFITLAVFIGCGEDTLDQGAAGPELTGVSSNAVVVGQTVEFFGNDIILRDGNGRMLMDVGHIRLHFQGVFYATDGTQTNVDLMMRPSLSHSVTNPSEQVLTWRRFGPFANPFTGDARIGRFEGTAEVIREDESGLVTKSARMPLEMEIKPSIVIEGFQPLGAECASPAPRALAGLAYQLQVRATGIQPTKFVYEISQIGANEGLTRIVHEFGTGNPVATDILGREEAVIFNPVKDDVQFYVTDLRVIAIDDNGRSVETAIPLTVHRPIEVRFNGEQELAQVYEPEPVSGCIPGSIGAEVSYEESRTETKQRSVRMTVSSDWQRSSGRSVSEMLRDGVSVGESVSQSLGGSEWEGSTSQETMGVSFSRNTANDVNFSTRDGETWGWNVNEGESNEDYESRMNMVFGEGSWTGTVGASAEGSVPGFAKVTGSTETSVGVTAGASTAGTNGTRARVSRESGYSMGGSRDETRSYGTTSSERESQSMSGSYALSNSRQRRFNDTTARSESRTWSFGSGLAQSQTVSEGMNEAESSTWQTSESLTTTQSYSGRIPRTKVGMFYRQTSRFVRRAEVRTYDLCGLATHAGELQFNEWEWAPDLAIGDDCSVEPPESKLPTARCYIPPCDG
ncbi:MAG: hypothetical protein CMH52_01100 [Myxococcales bacterium]|nr:hypothetical protein [Myxococcales bacterium]